MMFDDWRGEHLHVGELWQSRPFLGVFDFDWFVHDFGWDCEIPRQLNQQSAVNSHPIIAAVIVI
jgi:hypothetical protein